MSVCNTCSHHRVFHLEDRCDKAYNGYACFCDMFIPKTYTHHPKNHKVLEKRYIGIVRDDRGEITTKIRRV